MVDLPRRRETAGPVATAFLDRLRQGALRVLTTAPLPRTSLNGRVPDNPRGPIGENWPGDPKRGAAILAGDIEFVGELVRNPSPAWFPSRAGPEWLAAWHGFRRLGAPRHPGVAPPRSRAAAPDPARWRAPHTQPVGSARGIARPDRYPQRIADRPHRAATRVAQHDRGDGAGIAPLPPWRPPPRAVQQFGRGRRRPDRPRADPFGGERSRAAAGPACGFSAAAGGPDAGAGRYRQAAAAWL